MGSRTPARGRKELERLLTSRGWLAEQPPSLQQAILARGQACCFPAGTFVIHPGDPPPGAYMVISGRIKLVHYQPDGREVVLWPAEPGFWFGVRDLLARQAARYAAVAATTATLFHLPEKAFAEILAEEPRYALNFANILCHNLLLALRGITEILTQPVHVRVARLLALLGETAGVDERGGQELRLPQHDLAAMLGLSRVTVSKALQTLQAEGLIALRYGRIVVPDCGKLARHLAR
jgi:CRP-like cAMP-binding protein